MIWGVMRLIGGEFKGRRIRAPDGRETRPTSDRAREAIFNIIEHADWAPSLRDSRVMDVFAGSGALGFEALSRGSRFCLFVETDSSARGCIRETIESLQLFGRTRIHRRSALDLGPKPSALGGAFGIAFLDPPYSYDLTAPALHQMTSGGWLTDTALAVCETSADKPAPDVTGWRVMDTRIYGAARTTFLARLSGQEHAGPDR